MTPEDFAAWIDAMKERKLAKNKIACARLLGRSDEWLRHGLKHGTDHITALACAALLNGLEPFEVVKMDFLQSGPGKSVFPWRA